MRVLVLNEAEVHRLLPMAECIDEMAGVLAALARGEAVQPLRLILRPEGALGLMAVMPAYRGGVPSAFGVKVVGVFAGNRSLGKDAHQGMVALFSGETGEPLALVNASAVTAIRTAAVSGVATRALAPEGAGDLAIVGASVQARTHLLAMAAVRPVRRARIASLHSERAQAFARKMAPRFAFPVEAVTTVEAAVRGADLIVTATSAAEPVLRREWISPGAHLNVVGASLPDRREVDGATMAAARLFVDRRESTLQEAGDYLLAVREGAIQDGHIRAEIGDVLLGRDPGRTSRDEITLFKSLGLAVEDLAAAAFLHRRASETGAGQWVEI
jgi:ornithine cyclodeaminase/alanine dehydrogenase-like protein (mu-crystallin family)